ncbi:histidinol-phosphate transaminase [Pseudoclavibacter chungangensis]|uniref:Histidinol-phosphate aminotransferase n=1 Tax=Pseudoclavibacter chungangensis TaxID=587635 RepID=A0A7J5BN17_9MICO|nr:histidinol-phosphate transaminase [Pseudoclavibacter chungangensis]KAB1653109.1 histidinol-phosphate transaminase [Pseudoclavibacter chungangensis]NYJ67003.1 histidinol-phosphate aminotransferase [Pseudoclavibacter chungangensis]
MTQLDDLPIRDDLRGLSPYGAPQQPVRVAINVNENPYHVPEVVAHRIVEAIARELPGLNRYPDREFTALREKLASYLGHDLTPDQLWAANGSNEIMQQLLQVFAGPGRRVLSFSPSYSMYPLLTRGVGSEFVTASRDDRFAVTPELAREAIEREQPDVTILCTPNNPTGTGMSLETIEAAYAATTGVLIVDEAYAEFRHDGEPSALELLPGRERLVVSRTMSKAFAFAGVRVGYFAAAPVVADAVRLVRLPYHLSALTQAAAGAALDCADVMLGQVEAIRVQRDRIVEEVTALGYAPYPSEANFVLIGGVDDPRAIFEGMLERDILIRDVGLPGTVRVSAGTEEETSAFLAALAELSRPATA